MREPPRAPSSADGPPTKHFVPSSRRYQPGGPDPAREMSQRTLAAYSRHDICFKAGINHCRGRGRERARSSTPASFAALCDTPPAQALPRERKRPLPASPEGRHRRPGTSKPHPRAAPSFPESSVPPFSPAPHPPAEKDQDKDPRDSGGASCVRRPDREGRACAGPRRPFPDPCLARVPGAWEGPGDGKTARW